MPATTTKRSPKPKSAPRKATAKLSHARMVKLAKKNPPPQRWFDEDFTGLHKPTQK